MRPLSVHGSLCHLPLARVFVSTPTRRSWWKLHRGIDAFGQHDVVDFAVEVLERVTEEIRPDVFAEWSDVRERFAMETR